MSTTSRVRINHRLHSLYVRGEWDECLALVAAEERECGGGRSAYATEVLGLIERHRGNVGRSLELFEGALAEWPQDVGAMKHIARNLRLLGRAREALAVLGEVQKLGEASWEVWVHKAECLRAVGRESEAAECLSHSLVLQRSEKAYALLCACREAQGDLVGAVAAATEACEWTPENAEALTTLGLLLLKSGDTPKGFTNLGWALALDPRNFRAILGAGSVIQDAGDFDVALIKYRVAAVAHGHSPELWNNIGMCFFGKERYIAAISCLRRARDLAPFEAKVCYNLGITYLRTGQYASAFHYLGAAVSLDPTFAAAYAYMGVALARMDDLENAISAYERSLELDGTDAVVRLNFAISLFNFGEFEAAQGNLAYFEDFWELLDDEARNDDPEVQEQHAALSQALEEHAGLTRDMRRRRGGGAQDKDESGGETPGRRPELIANPIADVDTGAGIGA